MKSETGNEMEQIQKGLENFLKTVEQDSGFEENDSDNRLVPENKNVFDDKAFYEDEEVPEDEEYYEGEEYYEEAEDGDDEETMQIKKEKKAKQKKFRLTAFLLKLAVAAAILFAGLYFLVGMIYPKMNYQESTVLADGGLKEDGVTSVLLIGSDSRTTGNEGRSDAMILLTVSDKTNTVRMTSLLRDIYVEIPGHDGNRLNAAYAFGGPELLLETIRHNFDIEVYRYAVVNFSAFAGLVDAVEGVSIEVTNDEVQWINAYLNEYNELRGMPMETDYLDTALSGELHLNGAQALAYSRNRSIGSDFGRTERQRKVLSAVMKKLPVAVVKNPGQLVNGLFPNLTTNLTQLECTRLCTMLPKMAVYDVVQDSIPLDGTYRNASIRGMSVLEVDYEQNREYIEKEIYGK